MECLRHNPFGILEMPNELKADFEFGLIAVERKGDLYKFLSSDLKKNQIIALKAIKTCGLGVVKKIMEEFGSDEEIALEAIKLDGVNFCLVHSDLRRNFDFVMKCVNLNAKTFMYVDESLRSNEELASLAVIQDSLNISYTSLSDNAEFVLECSRKSAYPKLLKYIQVYNNDEKIVHEIVKKNGLELEFAHDDIKSFNGDIVISGININNAKCVGKTRFESTGDECEVSEQCVFSKISSPFGSVCVNGKCVAKGASKTIPIGSSCVYPNYVFDVCVSGAVCFGGTFTKKEQNDGSILCSRDEPCTNGQTCLFVYGKAGTCGTPLKDGEKCDHRAYCLPDRACRKSKESDSEKTCRPIAKMGEYCDDQFDCVGGFEIPTTLSRCVKNVCTRKYGAKNGESCSSSENCYSGYCEAGVCKDFYTNPKDCTSCDGICSCGGEKLVKDYAGKCIDACNGPKTDAEMCMFNMGAAYVAGAFNEFSLVPGFSIYQWYDEKSSLFTNCKTYFQRYYSCAKSRLEAAGIVGFPSTFGGMSLDNYKEGEPLMPIQPSSSYTPPGDKASSAVMLMSGSFKLFLVIVAVLGFLMM